MKKLVLILFLITAFTACIKQQKKTIQSQSINKSLRIVSLAQSLSQEIEDLGLGNNIVGATSYCHITKKNKDLIIGSSTEINIEKIILLKPDIVVASTLTQPNILESLTKSGINVYCMGKAASFEEICNEFLNLGKALGKEDKAKEIILKSKTTIDSIKNKLPKFEKKQKVFFQIGAKPLFSVIPNTYMNDYIDLANCTNIAFDMTSGTITREAVLKRNPDIIFVVTMGIIGSEEINIWRTYKQLSAVKNNQIFVLKSEIACTPTPINFAETFKELIKYVYKF
ncbi:MAG: ABC transporter substrate-binding protein [Bacteroidota bacterium]